MCYEVFQSDFVSVAHFAFQACSIDHSDRSLSDPIGRIAAVRPEGGGLKSSGTPAVALVNRTLFRKHSDCCVTFGMRCGARTKR